jgi:thiol-disulfide isomerase/thioredoxin
MKLEMRLCLFCVTAIPMLALCGFASDDALKSFTKGEMAPLTASFNRAPEPATPFLDANGRFMTLADLKAKGKILVVDLWATWCGGCVQEMPTLAKLQSAYPGRVVIVPISIDTPTDLEKARTFMTQFPQLSFYQNPAAPWPPTITTALMPPVGSFPTAIIFDGAGKERARMVGKTADWNGHDAHALFDYLLNEWAAPDQKPN